MLGFRVPRPGWVWVVKCLLFGHKPESGPWPYWNGGFHSYCQRCKKPIEGVYLTSTGEVDWFV